MKRVSDKQRERNKDKVENVKEMHNLFRQIWDEREDEEGYCYCFETGISMHGSKYRSNTACYDHVLEKGKGSYPEYKYLRENIIILHPDVHYSKGVNIDRCPKVKAYREQLLTLHKEGRLYDPSTGDEREEEE